MRLTNLIFNKSTNLVDIRDRRQNFEVRKYTGAQVQVGYQRIAKEILKDPQVEHFLV